MNICMWFKTDTKLGLRSGHPAASIQCMCPCKYIYITPSISLNVLRRMLAVESHLSFYLINYILLSCSVLFYSSDMWIKLCNSKLSRMQNNSRIH